jgi:hypothetical protein
VAAAAVAVGLAVLPGPAVNDRDATWHVAIGQEILRDHRVDGLGTSWLGVAAPSWRTSQWLSEVAMAAAVDTWGWRALVLARITVVAVLVAVLAVTLVAGRPAGVTAPVVLALGVCLPGALQDRAQTVSLLFVALLAAGCVRIWTTGRRPPLIVVGTGCLLWAQLHGMWVLAPAAFGIVALGAALDRGAALDNGAAPDAVRPALLATAASLAGVLNPWGPASFVLAARLQAATSAAIIEWRPTTLTAPFAIAWAALPVILVLAWVRSPVRVPRVELLWSLVWVAFGMLAFRNVAVSALMLAPVVTRALDRTWGQALRRRAAPSGRHEATALLAAALVVLAGGFTASVIQVARSEPLADTPARRIAERLAASPEPLRVFNAYDVSGSLIAFGGGKVDLVIDGRADLWGAARISRVTGAERLAPGWADTVDGFAPDALVIAADSALAELLVREGGWRLELRDREYVLLLPAPGRTP